MPRKKKSEFDSVHASVAQIDETKREIKELENMLSEDARRKSPYIQDPDAVKGEILKKKAMLERCTPKKFRGQKANRALAHARELEAEIKEAMPSSNDYFRPYPAKGKTFRQERDFDRSVRQQMAFQSDKKLKKKIREYKHIMRRIDPDDPTLTNIERLRR